MPDRVAADFTVLELAIKTTALFVGFGVKYAIITLGEAGAVYATRNGESSHVTAEKNVNVRDMTGAGFVHFSVAWGIES